MKIESNFEMPAEEKTTDFVVEKTTETTNVIGERSNQEALDAQREKNIDTAIDRAYEVVARIGNDRLYPGDIRNSGLGKIAAKVEMYFGDRAGKTGNRTMNDKLAEMIRVVRDQLTIDHDMENRRQIKDRKVLEELDSVYTNAAILERLAAHGKLFNSTHPDAAAFREEILHAAKHEKSMGR